ncbi:class II histone deacetylase [Streptomyces sp. NPDC127039]|uniref:class II histone deacetylase n=1 Tax=Streptomyces sp. NPDC127039 TaxID=3347115 RepID=UPI0036532682
MNDTATQPAREPDARSRTVAIVHEERYFWHQSYLDYGPAVQDHQLCQMETPESRRRLLNLLDVSGLLDRLRRVRPQPVTRADLLRVHTADYVDSVESQNATGGEGGEYTPFGPGGYDIARLSAGGVHAALDAVHRGVTDTAFALVRPPGHHAERDRGRGYCLFANIAVAVEKLRAEHGPLRVAVVDWDAHHGNGTQWIFYDDPDTLTVSLHQDRLYPSDSGTVEETGGTGATGANVNVPLPPGSGKGAYLHAFDEVVAPALTAFAPDVIVVACGFDASALDPNARMMLSATAFAELTQRILALADTHTGGRLAVVQEGGYSPLYVPTCGHAVVATLLGDGADPDPVTLDLDADPYQELQPHQAAAVEAAARAASASGALGRQSV